MHCKQVLASSWQKSGGILLKITALMFSVSSQEQEKWAQTYRSKRCQAGAATLVMKFVFRIQQPGGSQKPGISRRRGRAPGNKPATLRVPAGIFVTLRFSLVWKMLVILIRFWATGRKACSSAVTWAPSLVLVRRHWR